MESRRVVPMRNVAIVGSEGGEWTPNQRTKAVKKIREILIDETPRKIDPTGYDGEYKDRTDITLVSGGCGGATSENEKIKFCGGIDEWAEIIADSLGIPKDIKYPEINQFEDVEKPTMLSKIYPDETCHYNTKKMKGYKSRNIEVAEMCDVLYCLDPKGRKWSGGMWAMNYAKNIGKETHHIIIE